MVVLPLWLAVDPKIGKMTMDGESPIELGVYQRRKEVFWGQGEQCRYVQKCFEESRECKPIEVSCM